MIVYKLVGVRNGKRVSIMHKGLGRVDRLKYNLTYSTKRMTTPIVGQIFAFRRLKDAVLFARYGMTGGHRESEIWRAEVPSVKAITDIASDGGGNDRFGELIQLFWERCDRPTIFSLMLAPKGSIVVPSLKLTKRVKCYTIS